MLSDNELAQVCGGALPSSGTVVVTEDGMCINSGTSSTCYLADIDNYSASGGSYYSDSGLAFQDYGSCVEYYAQEFQDQSMADAAIAPPFGTMIAIADVVVDLPPTEQNYRDAAEICQ